MTSAPIAPGFPGSGRWRRPRGPGPALALGFALAAALLPSARPALRAAELQLVPEASSLAATVQATAHGFEARVERFRCAAAIDEATGTPTDVRLAFELADVHTGNETRDEEMLAWLEHEKHPAVEARLVAAEPAAGGIAARILLGMHGVENEVAVAASVERVDGGWTVTGEATLDHRRWGLPKIRRFLVLTVDPLLRVHFRLRFREAGAPGSP